MAKDETIILQQISDLRTWGRDKGFPVADIFMTKAETLWIVHYFNEAEGKWDYKGWGMDETGAQNHLIDLQTKGIEAKLETSIAGGGKNAPITQGLLDASEVYRRALILHEFGHLWERMYIFESDQITINQIGLDEGLAEYLALTSLILWYAEQKPEELALAQEYVQVRENFMSAVNVLHDALQRGEENAVLQAIGPFEEWTREWRRLCGYGSGKIRTREDYSLDFLAPFYMYSVVYFALEQFFMENRIDPVLFLQAGQQYRKILLDTFTST